LYASAYHWHSEVYLMHKEFEKAFAESQIALKHEPYSLIINTHIGINYIYAGKYQEAVNHLQKTIGFDSTFAIAHYYLGIAYIGLKQFDKAQHHLRIAVDFAPGRMNILSTLGYAEGVSGKKEEAKRIEEELIRQAENKYVPAYDMAVMSLGLGLEQQAIEYLEKAFIERGPWMPFIGMNPIFISLRNNPHFQELIGKIE
ncbi:MAG: tetratricopeptide repeat protein, partial [Cyclobacteriaceae bacterium]